MVFQKEWGGAREHEKNVYKPKPLKAFSSLLLTFTDIPIQVRYFPRFCQKILPPVQTTNNFNFWGKLIFKKIYTPSSFPNLFRVMHFRYSWKRVKYLKCTRVKLFSTRFYNIVEAESRT